MTMHMFFLYNGHVKDTYYILSKNCKCLNLLKCVFCNTSIYSREAKRRVPKTLFPNRHLRTWFLFNAAHSKQLRASLAVPLKR
jgi:hypothetical protein